MLTLAMIALGWLALFPVLWLAERAEELRRLRERNEARERALRIARRRMEWR